MRRWADAGACSRYRSRSARPRRRRRSPLPPPRRRHRRPGPPRRRRLTLPLRRSSDIRFSLNCSSWSGRVPGIHVFSTRQRRRWLRNSGSPHFHILMRRTLMRNRRCKRASESPLLRCGILFQAMSLVGQSRRTKQVAASPDVRFTSDSDQTGASQRSDALFHFRTHAPQQSASIRSPRRHAAGMPLIL
jgi:hypothetical protein